MGGLHRFAEVSELSTDCISERQHRVIWRSNDGQDRQKSRRCGVCQMAGRKDVTSGEGDRYADPSSRQRVTREVNMG